MKVFTSFSQALYDAYAHRVVESFKNWPAEAKLIIYSEDMKGEDSERIEWRDLNFPDLVRFKACAPPSDANYRWQAARFANKVWAMTEGSMNESGLCFWLDADCDTYRKLSADFLRRLIPPQYYLAYFDRPRAYPETGFWCVRANHSCHRPFMEGFKRIYTSGEIFKMREWHDAYVFGQYVRGLPHLKTVNLSGEFETHSHPMAKVQLAKYIEHAKGRRKLTGVSPENLYHVEFLERAGKSA